MDVINVCRFDGFFLSMLATSVYPIIKTVNCSYLFQNSTTSILKYVQCKLHVCNESGTDIFTTSKDLTLITKCRLNFSLTFFSHPWLRFFSHPLHFKMVIISSAIYPLHNCNSCNAAILDLMLSRIVVSVNWDRYSTCTHPLHIWIVVCTSYCSPS